MPSHGHRKCLVLKAANPCPRPRVIPTRGRLLTGQEKSATDQQRREIRQGPPQALLLPPEQMQWPMPASPRIAREPSCASVLASAPKSHAALRYLPSQMP